jgi:outer membrane protein OmpA-like peptidoglycan-associated protein
MEFEWAYFCITFRGLNTGIPVCELFKKNAIMKNLRRGLIPIFLGVALIFSGCASMNRTQKGAAVGTATGAAMGAVVGKASGNTALGAIIGAVVGGASGALIGHQMDKQAEEIKKTVPDAKVIRVGEGIVVEFSSNVLFAFDKANISADAKNSLDKLVKILDSYPDTDIEVQGHTDNKGSDAYNQTLSLERASSVKTYLSSKGISSSRFNIKGFGESLPKYLNDTENGRDQNRRVEFLITANDKMKAEAERQSSN